MYIPGQVVSFCQDGPERWEVEVIEVIDATHIRVQGLPVEGSPMTTIGPREGDAHIMVLHISHDDVQYVENLVEVIAKKAKKIVEDPDADHFQLAREIHQICWRLGEAKRELRPDEVRMEPLS